MRSDVVSNGEMPRLRSVTWGVRDIVASVFLGVMTIVSVLAATQVVENVRSGESGERIASASFGLALAAAIALVIAKLSRLRILPALTVMLAFTALGGAIWAAGGGRLEDQEGDIAGVPVTIVLFSVVEGVFFGVAWLYAHVKHGAPITSLGFVRTRGIRPYAWAIVYWLMAAAAIGLWAVAIQALNFDFLLPGDSAENVLDLAGGSVVLAVILVGILGPIAEEAFFRGFVLNGLRNRFSTGAAVLLSSALFGLFHVAPGAIVLTFLLGLAFAWIYIRTGSIWPAVFAHSLQNTLAILAAFFSD